MAQRVRLSSWHVACFLYSLLLLRPNDGESPILSSDQFNLREHNDLAWAFLSRCILSWTCQVHFQKIDNIHRFLSWYLERIKKLPTFQFFFFFFYKLLLLFLFDCVLYLYQSCIVKKGLNHMFSLWFFFNCVDLVSKL